MMNKTIFAIVSIAALIGSPNRALSAEKIQKFEGIEVSQISNAKCVGLRVSYKGKLSHQQKVQAYVNLNGASGIFAMERHEDEQSLSLTSCPVSCQDQKQVQRSCTDHPVEMRKVFFWAAQNGRLTPWFLELAFLGDNSSRDDGHHDNYGFYFP